MPVLLATIGLYLVYVGVKDVSFFDGMRSILRSEKPVEGVTGGNTANAGTIPDGTGASTGNDSGIDKLVTYAKSAYPRFKTQFPNLTIGGWRSQGSVPNSDHPKGKALDIMNPTSQQASAIIFLFRGMPGAKQWIWNNNTAFRKEGWKVKAYLGPNPHTDHVHLSFE